MNINPEDVLEIIRQEPGIHLGIIMTKVAKKIQMYSIHGPELFYKVTDVLRTLHAQGYIFGHNHNWTIATLHECWIQYRITLNDQRLAMLSKIEKFT